MIRAAFFRRDPEDSDPESGQDGLEKRALLDRAIVILVEKVAIQVTVDDFGPPLFSKAAAFSAIWDELIKDQKSPFYKYAIMMENGRAWLDDALVSVNSKYEQLNIQAEEFDEPDAEWQPLPLDRDDPRLVRAIECLEGTFEEVRSDNGYSANLPEERGYVLDGLKRTIEKLRTESAISWGYLRKNALEPLQMLIRRFSGAALEMTASAAKAAIFDWLKGSGQKMLAEVWKSLFGG
jgi:hypothetical protein